MDTVAHPSLDLGKLEIVGFLERFLEHPGALIVGMVMNEKIEFGRRN